MPHLFQQTGANQSSSAVSNPVHCGGSDVATAAVTAAKASKPPDVHLSWYCTSIPRPLGFALVIVAALIACGVIFAIKASSYGVLYDYQSCYESGGAWREASCLVMSGKITYGSQVINQNNKYGGGDKHKFWEVVHKVVINPDYDLNPVNRTFVTGEASKYPSWAHGEGDEYERAFDSISVAEVFLAAYRPNSTHSCIYNPSTHHPPLY